VSPVRRVGESLTREHRHICGACGAGVWQRTTDGPWLAYGKPPALAANCWMAPGGEGQHASVLVCHGRCSEHPDPRQPANKER